jgi:hypothetical protein
MLENRAETEHFEFHIEEKRRSYTKEEKHREKEK